jgi:hypothetical protein
MRADTLRLVALLTVVGSLSLTPAVAQSPNAATYITDEEVKTVNSQPGIDRTIRVVDIGREHLAVGIIHRGKSGAPPASSSAPPSAAAPAAEPCGQAVASSGTGATGGTGTPGGITHDSQTEGYVIVSGGGTLVTGGHIVNGRRSPPDGEVTKVLNGPSCSGSIAGAEVVKRVVKTGDIIIIPAGVPHGWIDIADHVDYLSIRPSDHVLEAGYVHPSIRK